MSLTARLEMERRGKLHFKKYQYLIPIYALALYMVEHTDYFSYWAIPSLLQMTINKVLLLEINAGERVGGGGEGGVSYNRSNRRMSWGIIQNRSLSRFLLTSLSGVCEMK